jgi:hypothetical protein
VAGLSKLIQSLRAAWSHGNTGGAGHGEMAMADLVSALRSYSKTDDPVSSASRDLISVLEGLSSSSTMRPHDAESSTLAASLLALSANKLGSGSSGGISTTSTAFASTHLHGVGDTAAGVLASKLRAADGSSLALPALLGSSSSSSSSAALGSLHWALA